MKTKKQIQKLLKQFNVEQNRLGHTIEESYNDFCEEHDLEFENKFSDLILSYIKNKWKEKQILFYLFSANENLTEKDFLIFKVKQNKYNGMIEKIEIVMNENFKYQFKYTNDILTFVENDCRNYGDITIYNVKYTSYYNFKNDNKENLYEKLTITFNIDS